MPFGLRTQVETSPSHHLLDAKLWPNNPKWKVSPLWRLQVARKKAAKAAELEEDALIVEYLRQRQLKEQVQLDDNNKNESAK